MIQLCLDSESDRTVAFSTYVTLEEKRTNASATSAVTMGSLGTGPLNTHCTD